MCKRILRIERDGLLILLNRCLFVMHPLMQESNSRMEARVIRLDPQCFFKLQDRSIEVTQMTQRQPGIHVRLGIVAILGDCRLSLIQCRLIVAQAIKNITGFVVKFRKVRLSLRDLGIHSR